MNQDFRVCLNLHPHPKFTALRRRVAGRQWEDPDEELTAKAMHLLCSVWGFAAAHCTKGVFLEGHLQELAWLGIDSGDLEILFECGFLDREDGCFRIHNWEKHNPWAAGAEARSERSSHAAKVKAAKIREISDTLDSATSSTEHAAGSTEHAAGTIGHAPSPLPSPVPRPFPKKNKPLPDSDESGARASRSRKRPDYPPGFLRAWGAYPHYQTRSVKAKAALVWRDRALEELTEQVCGWIGVCAASRDWRKDSRAFVPGMQVWLKGPDFSEAPDQLPADTIDEDEIDRIVGLQ